MMSSIKPRKIRRQKIGLHNGYMKEDQERGSNLISSGYYKVKGKLSLLQTTRSKRVPSHHHSTPFWVYFDYNLISGAIRPSARLDREKKQEGLGALVNKLSNRPQSLFFLIRVISPWELSQEIHDCSTFDCCWRNAHYIILRQGGHRLIASSVIAKYKHIGLPATGLGQRQVKPLRASSESSEKWNSKSINRSVFPRRVQGLHGSSDALPDELALH
ncbi:hypothetical protein E5676_scaffold323G00870 [Cucumis melo var. makuwa]|uniref:Uncharacterized protein n=1 Tax=Cucumis melo var. makuwa TaxID=1194695 RepID=A0A5D3CAI0_CUCMM|nr:hypothetical protein E5676_scaffold323G00870 [Cucumis melo var. makuwa]